VQEQFGIHVSASRSQPHNPRANKGAVLERLSQYYKIPQQQIATIGDGANDVLMFKPSGLSIAMGDASGDVKREATHVTTSDEDDGFAKAVEDAAIAAPVAATGRPNRNVGIAGPYCPADLSSLLTRS
jgi:hydroxymethylpyrimidine pyrophosphatase-like HAD family hydrolase